MRSVNWICDWWSLYILWVAGCRLQTVGLPSNPPSLAPSSPSSSPCRLGRLRGSPVWSGAPRRVGGPPAPKKTKGFQKFPWAGSAAVRGLLAAIGKQAAFFEKISMAQPSLAPASPQPRPTSPSLAPPCPALPSQKPSVIPSSKSSLASAHQGWCGVTKLSQKGLDSAHQV